MAEFLPRGLVSDVVSVVRRRGTACWVAGGYVRDWLMRRPIRDFDLVVPSGASSLARQIADETGGAFYVLDVARDAARVVYAPADDFVVDVTSLRAGDILSDLRLRDFTVDAMAVDLRPCSSGAEEVVDPTGGRKDLASRLLRATHEGAFQDDPIRLLRAVRLSAALGLDLEPDTWLWLRRDAHLMSQSSPERVRQELVGCIAGIGASAQVVRISQSGLLKSVLPELYELQGLAQAPPHTDDVYDHVLTTLDQLERLTCADMSSLSGHEREALGGFATELNEHWRRVICERRTRLLILKLATLVHDSGKPEARTTDTKGYPRYAGHEDGSSTLAVQAMARLRFSAAETSLVRTIVASHMRPGYLIKSAPVSRTDMYRFFRETGDAGLDVLVLSLADHLAARGAALIPEHYQQHLHLVREFLDHYFHRREEVINPPRLVTGLDAQTVLGVSEGPRIGQVLEAVREAQAEGMVRTREEALEYVRKQR